MKAEPILIQRPQSQSGLQRAMFGLITMLAWTFWVSLWLPLITLIAWLLGLQDIYMKLGLDHPLHGAGDLGIILLVGVTCALIFGSWALYNHARFSGKQKRLGNRPVGIAETARVIGASLQTAQTLQTSRCSTIQFTDDGQMYLDREEH